jgi:hypothetical protein
MVAKVAGGGWLVGVRGRQLHKGVAMVLLGTYN